MSGYEPGTVADVFVTTRQRRHRAVRVAKDNYPWALLDGLDSSGLDPVSDLVVTDVRPLVVLDLAEHFGDLNLGLAGDFLAAAAEVMIQSGGETREVHFLRWLVAQFDEQTRPPKPPEPTGLGAVVEDRDGIRWVRSLRSDVAFETPWRDCNDDHFARNYADINAVRVLSSGVAA